MVIERFEIIHEVLKIVREYVMSAEGLGECLRNIIYNADGMSFNGIGTLDF